MEETPVQETYVQLKIKTLARMKEEYAGQIVEKDGNYRVTEDISWFTSEMEELLPADRQIIAMVEDDYWVWPATDGSEFRLIKEHVEAINGEVSNPWNNPAGAVVQEPVKHPLADCPTVWNTKNRKKNSQPIEVSDLCVVKGLSIPQVVATIADDKVSLVGVSEEYSVKDVFPLYPIDKSTELALNDFYLLGDGLKYITKADEMTFIKGASVKNRYRITDVADKDIVRKHLKHYSCGGYLDESGIKVDKSKINSRFAPVIEEINGSLEAELIAKHYNISVDKVKPKEIEILKTVEELLDHPLCIKDREWVLLIGPSGSGKTTVCKEYAESKGLEYVIQQGSGQLAVADLLGYKSIIKPDISATDSDLYVGSLLREAIEFGKVFILDEIDACNPNTLLCLNSLKMDEVQFPDKLVKVHPDFRFMATANTLIQTEDYNGRSSLDRATLKRFAMVFYDLTEAELAVRFGLEYTKSLNLTTTKAYSENDYKLLPNYMLEPKRDLDPRDVQRIVRTRKIEEEKE